MLNPLKICEMIAKGIYKLSNIRAKLTAASEPIKISGKVKLTGRDKNGKVLFVKRLKNLITTVGFDLICNVIGKGVQPPSITHIAIGNGTGAGVGSTALNDNETHREPGEYAHTPGENTFKFTATFATVIAATQYGCLNAGSEGTLLNIADFSAITVDSLEIEVTFTLT